MSEKDIKEPERLAGDSDQYSKDTDTFPDGGLQAWSTLLSAALVQFATFGYTNAFGVYQGFVPRFLPACLFPRLMFATRDFYVREYLTDYTPSEIGWIGGVQVFLVLTLGVFTGRLFDRGYFHYLMISGALLNTFSFFMLSLSQKNQYYQVFLSQGIGGGLSTGMVYIPSLAIVSHYFQRQRALAMGIVAAGTALGAVLHPIMLNNLFHGSIGFHNGIRISAGMNFGLLIIANLVMRTRLPPRTQASMVPISQFARDIPYVLVTLGGLLVMLGGFFPVFFLQLDAVGHGVNRSLSFYCISILNASSIIGRTLPTFFAPKCGVFNLTVFFTFCMGALIYCLIAANTAAGFVVFAIAFGFVSGAGIGLTPPMIASLASNINEVGARIGVSFAISGFVALFGTPIAGALLTSKFLWWRPAVFAGTTIVGASGLFAVARYFVVRRKGSQIV